jgi:MEMO1 family protein
MSNLSIRRPAVAGQFYPGDPDQLREVVRRYIAEAALPEDLVATRADVRADIRAVIAPHAGYIYSGPTAGYAFKALSELPEKSWTVFLMGPAHRAYVSGVALGNYAAFQTPLGEAPVAVERVADMLESSSLYTRAAEAHALEHCLEVEVPFLQEALADFTLIPMLFGDVDPQPVAADLIDRIGPDDLIVVSSDLSHYHAYDQAKKIDQALLEALLEGNERGVIKGEACGSAPAVTLMDVARQRGWLPWLLDYRTSGDTAGDKRQVVGYGAVAYTAVKGE